MPITGVDFRRLVDIKTDFAYSGYYDDAKMNSIIQEATVAWSDNLFATNDRQRIKDDLFSLYKTNAPFTPVANKVNLVTGIADYNHLIQLKAFFQQLLTCSVSDCSKTSPIKVTIEGANNLRTGEQVLIAGVLGTTTANGYAYIKKINSAQITLYSDVDLAIPKAGYVTYISGGTIKKIVGNWTEAYDQKTSILGLATVDDPKHEVADGFLKLYPDNVVCQSINIDYVAKPTVFIDVTDNTIDLLTVYSNRFINDLVSKTSELMSDDDRDLLQGQIAQKELTQR